MLTGVRARFSGPGRGRTFLSTPRKGCYATRITTLAAAMLLGLVAAVGISASSFVPDQLVQVSGASPFVACTADAGQPGTVYPNSEVEPWLDANPAMLGNLAGAWQQDRWGNGGARGLVAGRSLRTGA